MANFFQKLEFFADIFYTLAACRAPGRSLSYNLPGSIEIRTPLGAPMEIGWGILIIFLNALPLSLLKELFPSLSFLNFGPDLGAWTDFFALLFLKRGRVATPLL